MFRNDEFLTRIANTGAFRELINHLSECVKEEHERLVNMALAALTNEAETGHAQIQLGRWQALRDLCEEFERYRSDNNGGRK